MMCRLAKLETLNVNGNYIQYVGDDVQALTALVELFMADNRLAWLPAALGKLKGLRTLDLAMNNLECAIHCSAFAGPLNHVASMSYTCLPSTYAMPCHAMPRAQAGCILQHVDVGDEPQPPHPQALPQCTYR
jgi:hypothetical protein